MSAFLSVAVARESGITYPQLYAMLHNLIIGALQDESAELKRVGLALAELGSQLENDDIMEPEKLAHAFKVMVNLGDQLTTTYQKLQFRAEVLEGSRLDAQRATEGSPIRLSA